MQNRLYGSRRQGALIGLLATAAGLSVAHLVAGAIAPDASPVASVANEFIDVVPIWLKNLAIEWFGTNDKLALRIGIYIVLGIVGALTGMIAQRRRAVAYALTAAIGVLGAVAVELRPDPALAKLAPTAVGTLVSIAVLWWLPPRQAAADTGTAAPVAGAATFVGSMRRRNFVQGAATIGLVSIVAANLGELLGRRTSVSNERAMVDLPEVTSGSTPSTAVAAGDASEFAVEGVDAPQPTSVLGPIDGPREFGLGEVEPFVVPNDNFYRIDTAFNVPQVSKDDWQLRIFGMVDRELTFTFADLLARPQVERYITLSCVSNQVGGNLVGNALFQGVLLADVLREAGVQSGATQVVSRSVDGWSCGSPTAAILDGRDAMIAFGMNGEPLPPEHGYPVRLVVPGLFGYVSATKWVTEIELARWEDFDGYWVPRGWSKIAPVKTMLALVDRPRQGRQYTPDADGVVDLGGQAWAVHRGVSRVEVSIDGGDWNECELAGVPSDDTWRQWRYRWDAAQPGDHTVSVHAYDGHGTVQPLGPARVAPNGAEGYHQVGFMVAAD